MLDLKPVEYQGNPDAPVFQAVARVIDYPKAFAEAHGGTVPEDEV